MKTVSTLRSLSPLVAALAFCSLLGACQAVPRYALTTRAPHKDCLAIRVLIDDRQGPEVYRSIASTEIERVLRETRELPLYEVRFEFYRRIELSGEEAQGEKLALVIARPPAAGTAKGALAATDWEIFLYP